ncbi:helix-turn-helix domain-containing protein [Mycobacterium riyadhense]|uniref:helix-turn-helix domain-containing protein n=1 Tax=Mycobacterium riyadhense TaxID=486698 RepID=UPI00195C3800|nr:helix-turn-helix transcriptional regulator [Mycobacterium riyadhense]
MENTEEDWHGTTAKRVGKAVADLRRELGLTAQELANRCSELGAPIHRTTITKIENGRPRFDLGELLILAAALNTAPVALLFPGPDYNAPIEVLPGVQEREIEAVQWFSGIRDHGFTDSSDGAQSARLRNEYRDHIRELRLWRELLDVYRKISSVRVPARRVNGEMVVGELSDAQLAQLDAYNDQVHFLRSQLGLEGLDDGG